MSNDEQDLDLSFRRLVEEQEMAMANNSYGAVGGNHGRRSGRGSPYRKSSPKKTSSIEEIELNIRMSKDPPHESTGLVRKRAKSVKETTEGIEDILDEMPSRTVGRKRGAAMMGEGMTSLGRLSSVHRHQHIASISSGMDATDDLYREILTDAGDVDRNELRDLAVNMTLKKKVRNQAKKAG